MSKRIKFFISHFCVSLIIATLFGFLVFYCWYPFPLSKAMGVSVIFIMLLAVDVVIGPLLGLVVYKEDKKSLKFDLAVVIAIQLSALCYGAYSIYQARPAWIVFTGYAFDIVRISDIDRNGQKAAKKKYQTPALLSPRYVALEKNVRSNLVNRDFFAKSSSGSAISRYPNFYTEIESANSRIKYNSAPVKLLYKYNDEYRVNSVLKKHPKATQWLGVTSQIEDLVVLLDDQGQIIQMVDLKPW